MRSTTIVTYDELHSKTASTKIETIHSAYNPETNISIYTFYIITTFTHSLFSKYRGSNTQIVDHVTSFSSTINILSTNSSNTLALDTVTLYGATIDFDISDTISKYLLNIKTKELGKKLIIQILFDTIASMNPDMNLTLK